MPIVSRVGGLADTVIDANPAALSVGAATGVTFAPDSSAALIDAFRRTIALYRDSPTWSAVQHNGLTADVSWEQAASHYAALFRRLIKQPASA